MTRRPLQFGAALVAVLFSVESSVGTAHAIGYFNLPGNFCQCFGYGCGPGYHATMVLGPPSVRGCFAHDVDRLWYAPGPTCGCSNWGSGCSECGRDFGAPSLLEPAAIPSAEPMPMPEQMPDRSPAAFRLPLRY